MFNHLPTDRENILHIEVKGKITKEDYETLYPVFEKHKNKHGNIRLLIELGDFHWPDAKAAWEDIKMDAQYLGDVEKIAVITTEEWVRTSSKSMGVIIPHIEITTFEPGERNKALDWLA